jgi:hypothetical protein
MNITDIIIKLTLYVVVRSGSSLRDFFSESTHESGSTLKNSTDFVSAIMEHVIFVYKRTIVVENTLNLNFIPRTNCELVRHYIAGIHILIYPLLNFYQSWSFAAGEEDQICFTSHHCHIPNPICFQKFVSKLIEIRRKFK